MKIPNTSLLFGLLLIAVAANAQEIDEKEADEFNIPFEKDPISLFPEEGRSPSNDRCSSAQTLKSGGAALATNVLASPELLDFCGDFTGGNVSAVWFSIESTGMGLRAAVNATYDVQMALFSGSCDDLRCHDGTTGNEPPWTYGEVKGSVEAGTMFYILVAGWEGASGDFELHVTDEKVPENVDISTAQTISLGESTTGDTDYASIPEAGEFPPCTVDEIFFGITAPSVWFSFSPEEDAIVKFELYADYDAMISVYEGDPLSNLTCVNSNDDTDIRGPAGPNSLFAQPFFAGTTYYLHVHGYKKAYGMFTLESEELEPAINDVCSSATSLEFGATILSDTLAATRDDSLPVCGTGTEVGSPGVWFSFNGTGSTVELVLNNTLSLHLAVYTGDCDQGLVCAGNQFFAFYPFVWDTVEGEEYKIFVYGREHALSDTFGIVAREVERPENDVCISATPLGLEGILAGSTSASSTDMDLELCGDQKFGDFYGGVWYTFTGAGDTRLVGLQNGINGEGSFDIAFTVFSGSCDALGCVEGEYFSHRDYDTAYLVDTVEGETYYVLVHGNGLSRGDFEISMASITRPENDHCDDAMMMEMGDTVQGVTEFATFDAEAVDFITCGLSSGGNYSAPGVWYTVEGGGSPVQVSVFADFDVQLTVFSGSCGSLTCVDGSESAGDNYLNAQVIWTAEEGVSYYILVHGFSTAIGMFEFFYDTAIF